jgi:hypothetical protein
MICSFFWPNAGPQLLDPVHNRKDSMDEGSVVASSVTTHSTTQTE